MGNSTGGHTLDSLLDLIEEALSDHPVLVPANRFPEAKSEASFVYNRAYKTCAWTAKAFVKRRDSRKKGTEIHGEGATPNEAVANLICSLPHWAEAIK